MGAGLLQGGGGIERRLRHLRRRLAPGLRVIRRRRGHGDEHLVRPVQADLIVLQRRVQVRVQRREAVQTPDRHLRDRQRL